MIVKDFGDMRIGTTPLSKLYYGHDLIWKREDKRERKEIVWTNRAYYGADSHDLKGVAYGNDRYVAVGGYRIGYSGSPAISAVSANSDSWSFTNVPDVYTTFGDVAYGEGVFLATYRLSTGNLNERIYSSIDGENWEMVYTLNTQGVGGGINAQSYIVYGDGSFIFYKSDAYGGSFNLSKDKGVSWNKGQLPITAWGKPDVRDIQFINGMFVGMGQIMKKEGTSTYLRNCLFYSLDGGEIWNLVNGTDAFDTDSGYITHFTSLENDIYISVTVQGVVKIYKANGSNFLNRDLWEYVSSHSFAGVSRFIGGGGLLLVLGSETDKLSISSDEGKTWDCFNFPSAVINTYSPIKFLNGKFIFVGNFGKITVGEIVTVSN